MFRISLFAVAGLLLSFVPLPEKVEYSLAELTIGKKATCVYSIGQVEIHKRNGTIVAMSLTKSETNAIMMVTAPFTVSPGDSIYFRRTVTISGNGTKVSAEKMLSASKFEKVYTSSEASAARAGVKLHDTLFNKDSRVQYIADVMYVNDTAIIASLDTITIRRNENGFLKAYTAPFKPESITAALHNINPERPVVVRVWTQMLLPEQAKFTIKTKSMLRDKKAYNVITTNANTVVPGYAKQKN